MHVEEERPGSFTSALRAGIEPAAGTMEYTSTIMCVENGLTKLGRGSAFSCMRIQLDHRTGLSGTTTRIIATANDVKCFLGFSETKHIEGQSSKK